MTNKTKEISVKSTAWFIAALALMPLACKTAGNVASLKNDEPLAAQGPEQLPGKMHCDFATPFPYNDHMEFAFNPTGGSLSDVKQRATKEKGGVGPATNAGNAQRVTEQQVTKGGKMGIRGYFKDLMKIDVAQWDCFALGGQGTSIVCLDKLGGGNGQQQALWVTDMTEHRFDVDLTVYKTACTIR